MTTAHIASTTETDWLQLAAGILEFLGRAVKLTTLMGGYVFLLVIDVIVGAKALELSAKISVVFSIPWLGLDLNLAWLESLATSAIQITLGVLIFGILRGEISVGGDRMSSLVAAILIVIAIAVMVPDSLIDTSFANHWIEGRSPREFLLFGEGISPMYYATAVICFVLCGCNEFLVEFILRVARRSIR